MLEHDRIEICSSFCLLNNLVQHPRLNRDSPDVASKDLRYRYSLSIEPRIFVVPLDDNRSIKLNPSIQAPTLHVTPQRFPVLQHFRLNNATSSNRACNDADFSTERNPDFAECFQGFSVIDDNHAVVDINSGHEADSQGVDENSGRRRPRAVFFSSNQNTGTAGSRNPQSSSHDSEDCETHTILDHLLGDFDKHFGLVLGPFGIW
jgi:hypothetical protein